MSVPKAVDSMRNETSADNNTSPVTSTTLSPEEQVKADEMLKLQQKITQEILNSNLKEKEMTELQVGKKLYCAGKACARKFINKVFPTIFRKKSTRKF